MVPVIAAEFAPKHLRGRLGACFQLFFASGVTLSYWVAYAASAGVSSASSTQWMIPVGLQFVPGGLLGLGMLLIKESPRWLAQKDRNEEAYQSLLWVRGDESPEVAVQLHDESNHSLQHRKYRLENFPMFGIFNLANIVHVRYLVKETNGKSLEEMKVVFGTVDSLPAGMSRRTDDGGDQR
ncbi:hypothetical protein LTR05_008209 [Lithohypha guttulata]|uniref:Major facilitator superfamily (MFS) profile domain-containing protein n=1 Tax=Lithohypha guttulata TaxID=1690604 RepID=A0AAN7YCU0_9EURO|nr:hypothetical protein LTR05_008209 [Lithohypha guttulata]